MTRDYDALTRSLLGVTHDDPTPRALRISGLYALLYLEDPLLHAWCGLASFVALQVHRALAGPTFGYRTMMAKANLDIYQAIVPSYLRLRDGAPIAGRMARPFVWIVEADRMARTDLPRALRASRDAVAELSRIEQTDVAQPVFATLTLWQRRTMRELFLFRLGLDSAAPVVRFPYKNPADLEQRLAFAREHVLPAWEAAQRDRAEWLRADCNRLRQMAGLHEGDLPVRLVDPLDRWRSFQG